VYARVTTVPIEPGKLDEAVSIIQTSVTAVMEKQAGYGGALLLANPDKNIVTSITLWETVAELTESQFSAAYQDRIAQLSDLVAGPPATETYEVRSRQLLGSR
jgi:quinol monooxygenase YgiN